MNLRDYPTSFRFTKRGRDLITQLSEALGINRVDVIELALRQLARRELQSEPKTNRAKRPKPGKK
jgi:hypothetical protein